MARTRSTTAGATSAAGPSSTTSLGSAVVTDVTEPPSSNVEDEARPERTLIEDPEHDRRVGLDELADCVNYLVPRGAQAPLQAEG